MELNSPEKTKALLDQNLTLDRKLKGAQQRIRTRGGDIELKKKRK